MAEYAGFGDSRPKEEVKGHEHPSEFTYIKIALLLASITVAEVAIYYIHWMRQHHVLVPGLLLFSAIKFSFVVGFFMHLKFDDRKLLYVFGGALAIALSIILALDVLFHVHNINYATKLF